MVGYLDRRWRLGYAGSRGSDRRCRLATLRLRTRENEETSRGSWNFIGARGVGGEENCVMRMVKRRWNIQLCATMTALY